MSTLAYTYNSVKSLQTSLTQLNEKISLISSVYAGIKSFNFIFDTTASGTVLDFDTTDYIDKGEIFDEDKYGYVIKKKCLLSVSYTTSFKILDNALTDEVSIDTSIYKTTALKAQPDELGKISSFRKDNNEINHTGSITEIFDSGDTVQLYIYCDEFLEMINGKLSIVVLKEF